MAVKAEQKNTVSLRVEGAIQATIENLATAHGLTKSALLQQVLKAVTPDQWRQAGLDAQREQESSNQDLNSLQNRRRQLRARLKELDDLITNARKQGPKGTEVQL